MTYNLVSAAAATGKTKSTILKAIKNGRISASKDELGGWSIDPAELHRVYPVVSVNRPSERGDTGETVNETEVLKARLDAMSELLRSKDELLEQVQGERDNLRDQNARLTALLPRPEPVAEPKKRGLLGWLKR